MTGKSLTRQVIFFVISCLMLAELLIFVLSAARFQYDWFERQWNHFVMQFDAMRRLTSGNNSQNQSHHPIGTPTLSGIAENYHIIPDKTAQSFHTPDFICWKDEAGVDHRLGEMDGTTQLFDLAKSLLFHFGLAGAILIGIGPEEVIVYDSRADKDFRATWRTDLIRSQLQNYAIRIAPHIERAISDATMMTQNMMNYLTETKSEPIMSFDLAEMADNLSHDTKLTITTQGTRTLKGMPNLFYRMLLNLARNAKRAGAENLVIDVWRAGHLAVIDISDDGPGIGADLKDHLFNAFYSGHKRDTGLGLAIAKDLSVAMGGELRLSRSSAHGSEFRLSVPKDWLAEG